ncbi:solute carrier family 35 member C2-like [Actinia tenebrosa]|uniref:Solute carrier family 35 member C2-like n=1 Tax=Actinia tenebrosa TaxID=6105 RepID=A0A6P8H7V9_ACTTE|nr:solute carrier family 35 member C2-like [Actinia tenebrosa]XP_031552519.1 solute carrier family 35 member C2-like [Actinia tenebrosa]XP_031552524.1 solute carrier family 35 member C2-like [Actinia tenebrosa]
MDRRLFGFQQLAVAAKTLGLVVFFYTFSISLTFYNKWMMKRFHFPLSVSVTHYTMVFIMASFLRCYWEFRKGKKRIILSWSDYLKRVFPAAVASALDIGLSNWSFMFITVSLYTMTKSTSIIFILIFALLFRIESWHISLVAIVALISGGLFMFTYQSTQFNSEGFFICLTASALSGIRWTLTQIIMQKDSLGLHNPIDTIYHIQPLMAMSLAPLAFFIEGHEMVLSPHLFNAPNLHEALISASMVFVGCFLAFMLSLSEFLLLSHTSSLTLSISGIFKEVCTLSLATEFGGDKMNAVNFVGLILCLSGIAVHVVTKATKDNKEKETKKVKYDKMTPEEAVQMLPLTQDEDDNQY